MKFIGLILLYLFAFALFYFVLSLFGMLWLPYRTVITDVDWFIAYTMILGWWLAAMSCIDYYDKYIDY